MSRYACAVICIFAGAASLWSCVQDGEIDVFTCQNPVIGHKDQNGVPDPCCERSRCPDDNGQLPCGGADGVCMHTGPYPEWTEKPLLVWFGNTSDAPQCPDNAMSGFKLGRDPVAPAVCPVCSCNDPACVLPAGMIASSATTDCAGPNFIDVPSMPDGSCSMFQMPIPPNQLKSIALLAPTLNPCKPVTKVAKDVFFQQWAKTGVVCTGEVNGTCADSHNDVCVPLLPRSSGWMHCIQSLPPVDEDASCSSFESYPNKLVLYRGIDTDASCTPCQCEPPEGSTCTAEVSAFTAASCDDASHIFKDYVIPLGGPGCVFVPPNMGLAGMTDKWLTNKPGKCAPSGGEPMGAPMPDHKTASVFCCHEPIPNL